MGTLIIAAKEKGLITKGGGHIMAAGFSLEEDMIEDFRRFLGEEIKKLIDSEKVLGITAKKVSQKRLEGFC